MGSASEHVKGQCRKRKGAGPTQVRICPAADILKATQQGAALEEFGWRLGCTTCSRTPVAHWHIMANTIQQSVCGGGAAFCQIYILKLEASVHLCAPRSQRALALYTQRQTALLRPMYPVSASLAVKPLNSTRDVGLPVSQGNCALVSKVSVSDVR